MNGVGDISEIVNTAEKIRILNNYSSGVLVKIFDYLLAVNKAIVAVNFTKFNLEITCI